MMGVCGDAFQAEGWRVDRNWSEADFERIHAFLSKSYWSEGIPRETLARAMRCSLSFVLRDAGGRCRAMPG